MTFRSLAVPSLLLLLVPSPLVFLGACGGRTPLGELGAPLVRPPAPDASMMDEPDGATPPPIPDAGIDAVSLPPEDSGPPEGPPDACAAVAPPGCTVASTCDYEFFPAGSALAAGTFKIETLTVTCQSTPNVVQQLIDGTWTTLSPAFADANNLYSAFPGVYDTGLQFPIDTPIAGTTPGTVQSLRACVFSGQCTVCDPPSPVQIADCGSCAPIACGRGYFLDLDCKCTQDICPCPFDSYPACPTPGYLCFSGGG